MMRKLLFHGPVHVFVIGCNDPFFLSALWLNKDFKIYIQVSISGILQVWEHFRDLFVSLGPERFKRLKSNNPWRNSAGEILCQERSEWNVFPGLDVARTPVVKQKHPKNMVV